jgi:hypothetical protein
LATGSGMESGAGSSARAVANIGFISDLAPSV